MKKIILTFIFLLTVTIGAIAQNLRIEPDDEIDGDGDYYCNYLATYNGNAISYSNPALISYSEQTISILIEPEDSNGRPCSLEDFSLTTNNSWVSIPTTALRRVSITVSQNTSTANRTALIIGRTSTRGRGFSIYIEQMGTPNCSDGVNYYPDSDGDGYGDYNAEPEYGCGIIPGKVTNNSDLCPNDPNPRSGNGCPVPDGDINWTASETFDIAGRKIGSSKSYFTPLGTHLQTQTYDFKEQRVWASQTLYDNQNRPAFSSLSAPISSRGTPESFLYKKDFIKTPSGSNYTSSNFESGDVEEPSPVGNEVNTLGWYYSNANTDETLQDITDRPYSRTIYSELNPGAVKQVVGGNKLNGAWRQGYSFTMPAAQEMYYVFGYNAFPESTGLKETYANPKRLPNQENTTRTYYRVRRIQSSADCIDPNLIEYAHHNYSINVHAAFPLSIGKFYKIRDNNDVEVYVQIITAAGFGITDQDRDDGVLLAGAWNTCEELQSTIGDTDIQTVANSTNYKINWLKATKTVVEDVHGNESVVFTDSDGKTLAAARAGGPNQYPVLSLIGEQKYVDVHIAKGCDNTLQFLGSLSNYKVYNLKTEAVFSSTPSTLPAGFYRIEYIGAEPLKPSAHLTYINKSTGQIEPVNSNAVGVRYNVNYYDYSLNYYNQVGKLVKTLQPLGFNSASLQTVSATTNHNENLTSEFQYNALGQLVYTKSPDEGEARFKYRIDGQIRFSQNSKQALAGEFSYTNYDTYGRPVESGVAVGNFSTLNPVAKTFSGTRKEQHYTEYDALQNPSELVDLGLQVSHQNPTFLSGNVAKTYNKDETGSVVSTTYYSYDVYGRVQWIAQNISELGVKTIDYQYDPVTSQVAKVIYQKNVPAERFIHRYTYNTVQQLEMVETSTDDVTYTTHANYLYYETGALKRTTLAEGIQNIDYVYNLAGQLKAINHPDLAQADDNDLFGMTLDYYTGDYRRNSNYSFVNSGSDNDQYNGNIKGMTWSTKNSLGSGNPLQYRYHYNKNNWLEEATFLEASLNPDNPTDVTMDTIVSRTEDIVANNSVVLAPGFHITATESVTFSAKVAGNGNAYRADDYKVHDITYDANGNIRTLIRNKQTENGSNAMDNFTYHYRPDKPNQLDHVVDAVTDVTNAQDLKTQTANNYVYNTIGQLVENTGEAVRYQYNASGLVTKVYHENQLKVAFYYDDKGYRTRKVSYNNGGSTTTFYVRDASGNPIAIYENNQLQEHAIYGAARLGVYNRTTNTSVYQLTDHLGNVRAVIAKDGNGNAAALVSATDYYPFGMPMPGRQIVGGQPYRYAYQGQEKDLETGKEAFQLRLWDSRIGRWLTTDPAKQYYSPYMAMGNNPITRVDPDGGTDIIYLDSDGNEIHRIAWEGDHIYMQETYSGDFVNGFNVGSFERVDSPVRIHFNPGINQDVVSVKSFNTLKDIGLKSKVWDITITSTARNARQQAVAMYNNLVRNYQEQRNTYRTPGQRVIDEYDASVAAGLNRAQTIQAMTDRINALGPGTVSRHAADHNVLNVMDLSQRNIPRARHNDFFTNGNAMDGVRILNENRVFHIEIHQN